MQKKHSAERGSHTSLANSVRKVPSDASLMIYPDSWKNFASELKLLLEEGLPPHAKYAFAAMTMHGLKNDLLTAKSTLIDVRIIN